jgi:hypothetical protein
MARTQLCPTATPGCLPADLMISGKRRKARKAYREHGFVELLTPDGYNPKLKKGRARGYSSAVLHLAPAKLSGYNVCAFASDGCAAACLNTAGHGGIIRAGEITNAVQLARIARTLLLIKKRSVFFRMLVTAIETHCRRARAKGLIPVVRLNGTSDLPWERMAFEHNGTLLPSIYALFPDVQFYDYTKNPGRAIANTLGAHPANYSLTFSRSEVNAQQVRDVLAAGGNVAVVFNTPKSRELPDVYAGHRVINGDLDDLRPLDPRGVVVGLRAKGKGRKDTSGFVVRAA